MIAVERVLNQPLEEYDELTNLNLHIKDEFTSLNPKP